MAEIIYLEAFVNRGKNRKQVLGCLVNGRKTQAEIHKLTGIYRTHVRRTLNELINKKLVKCLNDKDRIGKWYEVSGVGKKIMSRFLEK